VGFILAPLRGSVIYHFTHGLRPEFCSFAALRLKTIDFFPIPKGLRALGAGYFAQLTCQKVVVPLGGIGERPPPIHSFWRGGAGHLGQRFPPLLFTHLQPMGWKQYSRP